MPAILHRQRKMSFTSPPERPPHAVCVPFPAQGHITPFLKLAKLLHARGIFVTFVNNEHNHRRLLESRGPGSPAGLPGFRFEAIPDGLLLSDPNTTQHIPSLCEATKNNCLAPFRKLLERINSSDGPNVTCIVADAAMSFTQKVSEELGIPNLSFWTTSACGFMGYKQSINLMDRGIVPFKDPSFLTNGCLETTVEWIPGKKTIQMKDLPRLIRTTDPNNITLNFLRGEVRAASRASAIILHTFDALERDLLDAISSMYPDKKIYAIGPLQLHLDQITETSLKSIGSNLWKEETECLKWLHSKDPNTVIYVNFGSVRVLKQGQLLELAWGIANSRKNFLWVIRPDLVEGGVKALPLDFIEETKERGLITGWCPQEEVLKHPAIGGFITHSGWNSTIESITAGVPMISWPLTSEQQTNCLYTTTEWGIGMAINGDVAGRDEVEKLVRELVGGQEGKQMKKNVIEWKRKAQEAANSGGSSHVNLENFLNKMLQVKR